jgi:hypothetical protein
MCAPSPNRKPCVLLFLFYVSHLRVFVGPPFDLSHWFLFLGLLIAVCAYFFLLSVTASDARRRVLSEYEQEILTAKRLDARLASIVKSDEPIQDDLESTTSLLNELASRNSSLGLPSQRSTVTSSDLRVADTRARLRYSTSPRPKSAYGLNYFTGDQNAQCLTRRQVSFDCFAE